MTLGHDLQEAAEDGTLIVGVEETLKNVGAVEQIILASNTPRELRGRVREAAEDAEIIESDVDNEELGSLCMKPFRASVVGIKG